MAETTTKKKTAGRPKKVVEEVVNVDNKEIVDQNKIIKQLMEQIAEQNKKMEELQSKINENNKQDVVQNDNNFGIKKIKCINLMHNPLNISTEPNGMGRVYSFKNYGDSRMIKFDDIADIVASYPNTMEGGLCYICDPNAVEALGLSEEYKNIYNKEIMDRIVWLREESDVDLFIGMDKNLQESTSIEIAKLINSNERMDYNYLRRIKDECGIDIEGIAKELKELDKKANEED